MFVKNLMIPKDKLITVAREDSIDKALIAMEENDYKAVPVVENDKFFGAISKAKVYAYYYEKNLSKEEFVKYKVKDVIESDIPTVQLIDQIESVPYLLEKKEAAFVAVSDEDGEFRGIITHHKIFHEFSEVFGFNKGKRLAVLAYDIPGQLSKLSKIIYANHGDIISLVTVDTESVTEVTEIVIRLRTDNLAVIKSKIKDAGFHIV
jgi:acetoin utilization protein AcuB